MLRVFLSLYLGPLGFPCTAWCSEHGHNSADAHASVQICPTQTTKWSFVIFIHTFQGLCNSNQAEPLKRFCGYLAIPLRCANACVQLGESAISGKRDPLALIKSTTPLLSDEKKTAPSRPLGRYEAEAAKDDSCKWQRVRASLSYHIPFFLQVAIYLFQVVPVISVSLRAQRPWEKFAGIAELMRVEAFSSPFFQINVEDVACSAAKNIPSS